MIDRDLLARIKKCLALSSSSNEHEAAAALAKARALMAEHGITNADLAMADVNEAAARGSRAQRPARWEIYLSRAVERALDVTVFIDTNLDRRFIGRGPTPEIASYAFVSLFRRLKAARAAYIKTSLRRCSAARKRVRADAFCEGWALAVFDKIAAMKPKSPPDAGVEAYLAKVHPNLATIATRAAGADKARTVGDFTNGFVDGQTVNLHHGMGTEGRRQLAHA